MKAEYIKKVGETTKADFMRFIAYYLFNYIIA